MDFTGFVTELGIDKMPESDQQIAFEYAFSTLQKRMSLRLAEILSEAQLQSLDEASQRSEQAGMEELDRLVPDYLVLYQEEIDKLKQDMLSI